MLNCKHRIPGFNLMTVLTGMEKAYHTFYLTGSRFFGNEKPTSDWDFYAEDCLSVKSTLRDLGFVENGNSAYLEAAYPDDPNVATVMQHTLTQVQVQLIKEIQKKHHAQAFLNNLPPFLREMFDRVPKADAKNWWRWAYREITKNPPVGSLPYTYPRRGKSGVVLGLKDIGDNGEYSPAPRGALRFGMGWDD